ncbi:MULTISPECIES: hypothetical protein [unclassified Leifsonia]|uniref:hypothetical protein n=1 Tax=unclassified Leifsonia TaxID=2663824 RepID=UPI0006FA9195|nr:MULTISPECIES: hypothetical protein [unclassified Leifsonia]KQX07085.1 hypothetical protein ASC59_04570 [Leifsonia sp. Root1293]KRA11368.1 hypothetical protein ASD61_04570 [Leifsonia sp. Root60]
MTNPHARRLALIAIVATVLAGTSACTDAGSSPAPAASVEDEFTVTTLVIDRVDTGPVLCLGAVFQSNPPGCSGVPIAGWDWDAVGIEESRRGTTWGGDYAVQGTWDGSTFTLTRPAEPAEDGSRPPGATSTTRPLQTPVPRTAEELDAIRIAVSAHPGVVMTGIETTPDRVLLTVAYDDGDLQASLDEEYGSGTVLVSSALSPVS